MRDQAAQLRSLVLRSARQAATELGPTPRLVALAGGKEHVGTSTLAVNLAVAAAGQGARVVLVDADLAGADLAALCGLRPEGHVADVLAARRDIHEILQLGPAGIQVACGAAQADSSPLCTEAAQERLIKQLRALGRHADLVVLDVGAGASEIVQRFWRAADEVLLTTTPDVLAVLHAYATIKLAAPSDRAAPIGLVMNQVASVAAAEFAYHRIDQSCRRFLKRETALLGCVPLDEQVAAAARSGVPLLIHSPAARAAVELARIAGRLAPETRQLPRSAA